MFNLIKLIKCRIVVIWVGIMVSTLICVSVLLYILNFIAVVYGPLSIIISTIAGLLTLLLCSFFMNYVSFKWLGLFFSKLWFIVFISAFFTIFKYIVQTGFESNSIIKFENIFFALQNNWFGQMYLNFDLSINSFFYILTISVISIFANYHTLVYMKSDQKKEKFQLFLNGFALSMMFLVMSKNFMMIFLCWEFLGITSFFLIKHYDIQADARKAAWKAFSYNICSDICFIISMIIFFALTKTLDINDTSISLINSNKNCSVFWTLFVRIFLILIFIASCVKSVQIFCYMWLPDSMKAPVPASALIHSATLVAAGFYIILLFKSTFFIYFDKNIFIALGWLTAFIGSICAAFQTDVKKILAFSTVANCGFMLVLIANYDVHIFLIYFVCHGILKSACFMITGDIVLFQSHNQDMRSFKSMFSEKKKHCIGIIFALISLAGFPITTMYFIKHIYKLPYMKEYVWFSFDSFFYAYSVLSLIYGINYCMNVFYYSPNSKEWEETDYKKLSESFKNVNKVYTLISFSIGMSLAYFWYTHIGLNSPTLNYFSVKEKWIIPLSSLIFFCAIGMYFLDVANSEFRNFMPFRSYLWGWIKIIIWIILFLDLS